VVLLAVGWLSEEVSLRYESELNCADGDDDRFNAIALYLDIADMLAKEGL
jgi:hypothetical protein